MKQAMALTTFEQLKAISDPLRAEMIMKLIETSHTGQQLAVLLETSRPKIHYHLKELEKNGLIEVIRTEEKHGIIQKFYRAAARGFFHRKICFLMQKNSANRRGSYIYK